MKHYFLYIFTFLFTTFTYAQKYGCTDILATNYNKNATVNNGSCKYKKVKITPVKSWFLEKQIRETSGLVIFDSLLWSHNDSGDSNLYGFYLDSVNQSKNDSLKIDKEISLVKTTDWEAVTQDDDFIYLGDFGNNYSGNRQNLKVNKISKKGLYNNTFTNEEILFSYENQHDFSKQKTQRTNFDCEAMISIDTTLYLFSKQWANNKTTVYKLSKKPGKQIAKTHDVFNIKGLVTGATYLKKYNLLVVCGYTKLLKPFVYLFYDFNNDHFFSGNRRKIKLKLPFYQIEGIATSNGLQYYISNEEIKRLNGVINVPAKLHILDLSPFLKNYISTFGGNDL